MTGHIDNALDRESSTATNDGPMVPEIEVRKIVRLLGTVAGLHGALSAKRRKLMAGLAVIVEADAWSWIISRASMENNNPAVGSFQYGGLTEEQFVRSVRVMQDRQNPPVEYKELNRLRLTRKRFTRTWDQLVPAEEWYAPRNRRILQMMGFEHVLYCVRVLDDDGLFSGIALNRKFGRPNFTPLQRRIAHIVTGEIEWLHHDDTLAGVTREVRPLPPRLRTVLTLLVNGHSVKEIAGRLDRSYHTVNTYTRDIHRYFNVRSRAQLLRHFMAGDGGDVQ